jgi:hypothetical protein
MQNVVAVCLGFCGVVLFTQLLRSGTLGGPTYATLVSVILLSSIAVSKIDLLQVLDMGKLRLTLREIEQVRDDIYAKSAAVTKLGEELGELAAWNVRTVNRFVGDDHASEMLRQRNQIVVMLKEIGVADGRIQEIVAPINDTILGDLKQDVIRVLVDALNKANQAGAKLQWEPLEVEFRQLLTSYDRTKLIARAKTSGLYTAELEKVLDRVDGFIKTKEL